MNVKEIKRWKVIVTNTENNESWQAYNDRTMWDNVAQAQAEADGLTKQWPHLKAEVVEVK